MGSSPTVYSERARPNSLDQKLLLTEAMINDEKTTPAVNKLQAFINRSGCRDEREREVDSFPCCLLTPHR